jgi:hypothetical protein
MIRGAGPSSLAAALFAGVSLGLALPSASQQTAAPKTADSPSAPIARAPQNPVVLSVLTSPPGAHLSLTGESDVAGQAPLDLPTLWNGRYSVIIEGAGASRTQGVLFIPPRGGLAYALSEPPGASIGLLIRSMNFPGFPAISSGHRARGGALALAGASAIGLGVRAHVFYRNSLKDDDLDAPARARNFKRSRDQWAGYLGAVWGASALDYWIRARMSVLESTPSRVTLSAPVVARSGVIWRSLIVPGAGQEFANRRGRALFWLGASLAAGAGYVVGDEMHQTDVAQLAQARRDFENAGAADSARLWVDMERRRDDAQTSQDIRDGFRSALLVTYLCNVFDSFVVPIGRGAERAATAPKLSAISRVSPGHTALALQYRF